MKMYFIIGAIITTLAVVSMCASPIIIWHYTDIKFLTKRCANRKDADRLYNNWIYACFAIAMLGIAIMALHPITY